MFGLFSSWVLPSVKRESLFFCSLIFDKLRPSFNLILLFRILFIYRNLMMKVYFYGSLKSNLWNLNVFWSQPLKLATQRCEKAQFLYDVGSSDLSLTQISYQLKHLQKYVLVSFLSYSLSTDLKSYKMFKFQFFYLCDSNFIN